MFTQDEKGPRSDASAWLADEIESLARRMGATDADCRALGNTVSKLAERTGENGETYRAIPPCEERDFLEKAKKTPPLNRLAGTPETFLGGQKTPLVFDAENSALYFFRRYKQEWFIAQKIAERATAPTRDFSGSKSARELIAGAFPFLLNAQQKLAVRTAISRAFTIVSGGPGTGKTALLLRALLCIFSEKEEAKILLAAPTGKAASRMKEAILAQLDALSAATKKTVPANGAPEELPLTRAMERAAELSPTTLHALLHTGNSPLRNPRVPALDAECVVVDESSMIDQALMYRLLCAVSPETKIILLGDKNQIDSVGAGHVFGALCDAVFLQKNRIELTESHRFSATGTLGKLARSVISGDVPAAGALISAPPNADADFVFSEKEITPHLLDDALRELFPKELRHVPANAEPEKILALFETTRALSPLRVGNCGTEFVNARATRLFAPAGTPAMAHFHGQPIIITRNAPQARLFNGDCGVVLKENDALFAYFRGNEGLNRVPVAFLPEHETAYAMSVHKSQGSEFSRLLILFPANGGNTDLFSRQLLYTALTRFRENGNASFFRLIFDRESLLGAVARENPRRSLLAKRFPDGVPAPGGDGLRER